MADGLIRVEGRVIVASQITMWKDVAEGNNYQSERTCVNLVGGHSFYLSTSTEKFTQLWLEAQSKTK